jgi:hypothetical protein
MFLLQVWQSCVDNAMDAAEAEGSANRAAVEQCAGVVSGAWLRMRACDDAARARCHWRRPPYVSRMQTAPLFECMAQHPAYYGPQLDGMAAHKPQAERELSQQQHGPDKQQQQQQQHWQQQQPATQGGDGRSPPAAADGSSGSSSRHDGRRPAGAAAAGDVAAL